MIMSEAIIVSTISCVKWGLYYLMWAFVPELYLTKIDFQLSAGVRETQLRGHPTACVFYATAVNSVILTEIINEYYKLKFQDELRGINIQISMLYKS